MEQTAAVKLHNVLITPLPHRKYLKIQLAQGRSGNVTKTFVLLLHQTSFFPLFFLLPFFPSLLGPNLGPLKDFRFGGMYYIGF